MPQEESTRCGVSFFSRRESTGKKKRSDHRDHRKSLRATRSTRESSFGMRRKEKKIGLAPPIAFDYLFIFLRV